MSIDCQVNITFPECFKLSATKIICNAEKYHGNLLGAYITIVLEDYDHSRAQTAYALLSLATQHRLHLQ